MKASVVWQHLGLWSRGYKGLRRYSTTTVGDWTTGGQKLECHLKQADPLTSLDEFRGFQDCPDSRATLQLVRRGKAIAKGSPLPSWIFAHEIKNFDELQRLQEKVTRDAHTSADFTRASPGSLCPLVVNIMDCEDGSLRGVGLFHCRPLIAARVLEGLPPSRSLDAEFLFKKLLDAASRRRGLPAEVFLPSAPRDSSPQQHKSDTCAQSDKSLQGQVSCSVPAGFYRLVHGEADGLPGLIVECFGGVVVVQQLTRGSELLTAPLLSALQRVLRPPAVVLRNDSIRRQLERDPAMKEYTAVVNGNLNKWQWIHEGGSAFPVDLLNSPDTGWYYDRRDVRQAVARMSHGVRMLDLYCHSAAFSIGAVRHGGAKSSVCVDNSSLSLKLAAAAAEANNVKQQLLLQQADALQWLRHLAAQSAPKSNGGYTVATHSRANEDAAGVTGWGVSESIKDESQFDLVIIDPPPPYRRGLLPAYTDELQQLATAAACVTSREGRLVVVESSRFLQLQELLSLLSAAVAAAGRTGVLEMHGGPTLDCPQDLRSQGALGMNWVMLQLF